MICEITYKKNDYTFSGELHRFKNQVQNKFTGLNFHDFYTLQYIANKAIFPPFFNLTIKYLNKNKIILENSLVLVIIHGDINELNNIDNSIIKNKLINKVSKI